jgi:hypothetical protein
MKSNVSWILEFKEKKQSNKILVSIKREEYIH